jgi:predicted permease
MSWLSRVVNALNPRRLDEDLAEEIRDHLERRAAALRAQGLDADEARQQTRLRFGSATRMLEESRDIRLSAELEGTLRDVRYGWRGMRKAPAFALTAVLSLALAIGATTAVYSIVDAAILRSLPVPHADRIVMLTYPGISDPGNANPAERQSFSYPEFVQFATVARPAGRLALFSSPERVEARPDERDAPAERINWAYVSGDAFDMLGVGAAVGRLFSAEQDRIPQDRPLAVLSHDYWRRRFQGDPTVLGRRMVIAGKLFEIVGVAQKGFFGVEPGRFVDVWVPGTTYEARALTDPGWHWFRILGRLAAGAAPDQLQDRLQPSFHDFQVQRVQGFFSMPPAIRKQFLDSAIRIRSAATGVSDFRQDFARPLWIVFAIAAGILLMACANVASLLLARSTARASEMAMRISLGAARSRLVRQMLTESLLLSLLAGALGWLLARTVGPLLVGLLSNNNDPVQFALAVDTRVLMFSAAVSAATTVFFGLIPAWQTSGGVPMHCLRSSSGQSRRLKVGKLFVGFQVACAFCLVAVGAAFVFSLANLYHVDPGFDSRNVAVLSVTTEVAGKADDPVEWAETHRGEQARLLNLMFDLQNRVASQPGVQSAALAWWPIFRGTGWSSQVLIPGHAPSDREEIFYRISPSYFATLRTPLISGRDFTFADANARQPTPAIVNEAFARRYFNSRNVVGREFSYPFRNAPIRAVIVGVTADAHYYDLRGRGEPMVYLPVEGNNSFTLYVRSQFPLAHTVRLVERETHALGSGTRLREVTSLELMVGNTLVRERLLAGVGGTCASFGLLLAVIGLFGLLSYTVGRRTREIGVRVALGAQRRQVVSLVLWDVAGLMGVGLTAGVAGAFAALAAFRSLLFGIRSADPSVAGTAVALFLMTGMLAAGLPAHRAATMDPMRALREE